MQTAILWVLVLALTASAHAVTPSTGNVFPFEQKPERPYESPGVRVQGDTVDDPFLIGSLPFSATGTTCGFNHDYDHACPYFGSTAPDVVYQWTAVEPWTAITIDLCNSTYDTKVYVYEDAAGVPIACNDDYCSFQSHLRWVPVTAGHDYFIVVDGYGGDCGTYDLQIYEYVPCVVDCPAGAMPEGEPDCYDGYDDQYNGGCNVPDPFPIFQEIDPSCDPIVICGTTGVFMFGSWTYRDTDWFELDITTPSQITLSGDSEVPVYFMILDGRIGCAGGIIPADGIAGPCAPLTGLTYWCAVGPWWMFVCPETWDLSYVCGSVYWMEITGYVGGVTPDAGTTWGSIKGLFR